jgi:hypothetical protein
MINGRLAKKIKRLTLSAGLILVCLLTAISPPLRAAEIMKLSEIKAGMKGEGRSIFKGTRIETFPFTVLGVIEKFLPGKNLIIVKLEPPFFQDIGIIAGMSGSPAYIDGKLIGAIAYGFSFSKTPIGGITPIEDILKVSEHNTPAFSIDISNIRMEFDKKSAASIAELVQKELARRMNVTPPSSAFAPIGLLGSQRGFSTSALTYLKPVFSTGGMVGSAQKQLDSKSLTNMDSLNVSPADAVSVPLISGDFEYSFLGTATHVDKDKIYIFGHPIFNLGPVDFPLHKAEVITIVPSYEESFKMASTRNMVGRIVQDRHASAQGELGKVPYMIPMNVFLVNKNRQFKLELINHPLLTPVLSALSIVNIFTSEFQDYGFLSIDVDGKIYIEGEKNIVINDLYSGTESFGDFSNLLLAINFFLMNNKEKNIKIQKIDFEINGSETVRVANIENVLIDKKSYLPGEIMNISVLLENERGGAFTEPLTIKAPNLKPGSEFYLLVADGGEMGQFDAKNVRTNYFPVKLGFLIRAINNLRKNNRLYLKLMTPTRGLFVKGYEYPNLPASLKGVFTYDQSPIHDSFTGSQSDIKYSTITEYQMEFPSVIKGKKLFKLRIKERADDQ